MKHILDNFNELTSSYKQTLSVVYTTNEEKIKLIQYCENLFNKKSEEFIREYIERNYEGSPLEGRWFRFSQELIEKGVGF